LFQSLLVQVLFNSPALEEKINKLCFNPFWFRSSLIQNPTYASFYAVCFNLFWFRSSLIQNPTYASFYAVCFNPFWFRSSLIHQKALDRACRKFQSLLVQVLFNSSSGAGSRRGSRFNPFWFRSSLILTSKLSEEGVQSFNPFWFRSSLIPSLASGPSMCCFNPFWFRSSLIHRRKERMYNIETFQSLLVQVLFNSAADEYVADGD
jgi:hypothetical protein